MAARTLTRPSSLARALAHGDIVVERIDLRVAHAEVGFSLPGLDRLVERIEQKLPGNRLRMA
jgi:hypothetical protein